MAKKLIKYGKFLMSMALIFCMMAPSYAALSNTDGASFVTKAEFDSALADFNSRLTTFEAGINSKIDSQVTSYLEKNGIWKDKIQTLETTSVYNFGSYGSGGGYYSYFNHGKESGKFAGGAGASFMANYYVVDSKLNDGRVYKFIENVSKSGLMCLFFNKGYGSVVAVNNTQSQANFSSDKTQFACCRPTNAEAGTHGGYFYYETKLEVHEATYTDAAKTTINVGDALYVDDIYKSIPLPSSFQTTRTSKFDYFFVKKDTMLVLKTVVETAAQLAGICREQGYCSAYWGFSAKVY